MLKLSTALLLLSLAANVFAASVCPVTPNTTTDCGYRLTLNADGTITGSAVSNATPYDGNDDALIGVINNTPGTYNGSFNLSGSGNGGGIFDFDGDGICIFTNAAYCSSAATGYEGPKNTFSNIQTTSVSNDTGTVNIFGLAAGSSTYFSLESSPSSINSGSGPVIAGPAGTPEPSTISMLGAGLLGCWYAVRRRHLS